MESTLSQEVRLLVEEFKDLIMESFPDEILEIRVFGSQARREARSGSDVDVLVVTRHDEYRLSDRIIEIACDLLSKHGMYISPKVISRSHREKLEALDSDFLCEVERDGILL